MVKEFSLKKAIDGLSEALKAYDRFVDDKKTQDVILSAVVKNFEVLVEYVWKSLKSQLESEGLDLWSPKEIIRQAASANLLVDPEFWINAINIRNDSVHGCHSIKTGEIIKLAREVLENAKKGLKKLGK